jgi:hypothetical protein
MSKNRTDNPNVASGRIDTLEKDEIFVFGSNLEGKHLGVQQKRHTIDLEPNGVSVWD